MLISVFYDQFLNAKVKQMGPEATDENGCKRHEDVIYRQGGIVSVDKI